MIRIVLADDHKMLRQGFRLLLEDEPEFEVVGEADDGLQAIKLVSDLRPDILVTDLRMPGADGLEVTREVARVSPHTGVVILSLYGHVGYVTEAFKAGAKAYVRKDSSVEDLVEAIKAVLHDRFFMSSPLAEKMVESYSHESDIQE